MCFYAKKYFVTICACKFKFVIINPQNKTFLIWNLEY